MTDFFSSEAGQCASIAKQFLEGALTLDAAQRDKGPILFRPTLALAGHGLELMLKACFYLNGQEPPISGKKGHDIISLWERDICKPVKDHVFANANRVAEEDRASGAYLDVPEQDVVQAIIAEYVIELGKLHGNSPYKLRYAAPQNQKAPRTPLLVKSLWGASDDLVKRPNDFVLSNFRI
nr:hypothetical protein [uncultured Cohaesibacter sp.]